MLHETTPAVTRLRLSAGNQRCLLPMLNRDEETTMALKKLIADFAGVPHGSRLGVIRKVKVGIEAYVNDQAS